MNIQTLSARTTAAALAIGLVGCATPPPSSHTSYSPPPSGYVSVHYVQPTPAATAPVADASGTEERARRQAHMRRALAYLQAAKGNLQAATMNRGGHREGAIQYTDEAIGHVEAGIANANAR